MSQDATEKPNVRKRSWEIFEKEELSSMSSSWSHISLFSGCGGFDLGFTRAGFETLFAIDNNVDACQTFEANLGEITCADINSIKLPRFRKRIDVLTAGFPCQPFSNAGSRRGVKDSRGSLYESALEAVSHFNPRVVVFENVRGLLSFKNGRNLLVGEICEALSSLNYNVTFSLIDATKHHVPQKRLRLFVVGVSKKGRLGSFGFPKAVMREDLALKDTILDIPRCAPNRDELMKLNPQAVRLGSMVPEGGSWKDIPYDKLPERLKKISDNMAKYRWPKFSIK